MLESLLFNHGWWGHLALAILTLVVAMLFLAIARLKLGLTHWLSIRLPQLLKSIWEGIQSKSKG